MGGPPTSLRGQGLHCRGTGRNFRIYLGTDHNEVTSLDRCAAISTSSVGWQNCVRGFHRWQPVTYISRLIFLRGILAELASSAHLPELAQLLRRQDVPTRAGLNGVIDSLLTAQHVTEMYRRKLAGWRSPPLSGPSLQPSTKMLSLARKLDAPEK